MQNYNLKFKILVSIALIGIALIERLWLDLGSNVELITLATFIAGFYLGKKWAIIIPLIILAVSDTFKGNTNIMLFTWSAYLVIGVGTILLNQINSHFEGELTTKKSSRNVVLRFARFFTSFEMTKSIIKIFLATGGGAIASIWFYLWTNFGVWFLDSWGMYPKTFNGLVTCYVNGIPFFKNQLFSNLLIIPVGFFIIEFVFLIFRKYLLRAQVCRA